MNTFWTLVIVQAFAAVVQRWVGKLLFGMGPDPQFWNLPAMLQESPMVTKTVIALPTIVSIGAVICGFVFSDHAWWLLGFAVVSMAWASPPYRSGAP